MSINAEVRTCISSPPDRKKLVLEIFVGDEQLAEINQEQDALEIEIYSRRDKKPWKVNLSEFENAIKRGATSLG